MDNYDKNIDNLIKGKFSSFEPVPPPHIWEGIRSGIESKPAPLFTRKRIIASAAILVLAIFGFIYFNPTTNEQSTEEIITSNQEFNDIENNEIETTNITEVNEIIEKGNQKPDIAEHSVQESSDNQNETGSSDNQGPVEITDTEINELVAIETEYRNDNISTNATTETENKEALDIVSYYMNSLSVRSSFNLTKANSLFEPEERGFVPIPDDYSDIAIKSTPKKSFWKLGYYITPEISVSNIDSVEILNTYSFSVEPSYYFNKNLFISTGIGLAYARDRGYARIQYVVNEYMGSYDDVYDITFDTVQGNIVPVYHTKTVEVWDTVRHISISSITNQYLYLQIPVLIGYSYQISNSPVSWYIYGGPAMYLKTAGWIEKPEPKEENADIINLKNNLPVRADSYFQIWVGSGLEYTFNNKFSVAVEPGYRHYLSNIYLNTDNKGPSSGFNLRIGLIYKP